MRVWRGVGVLFGVVGIACGDGSDPVGAALGEWPDDPEALLEVCGQQQFSELAVTCRVQAAARLGRQGSHQRIDEVCAQIPEGTWRDECHFRGGEELGMIGETVPALGHCLQAGWFARNCLTHVAWRLPPDPELRSDSVAAVVNSAGHELLSLADQVLAGAPDGLEGEGRDILMARFGYNLYVGRGVAAPEPARLPDPLGIPLRTGFAIEVARLLTEPSVASILAVWNGEMEAPTGTTLAVEARQGRYRPPMRSPVERDLPFVPVYGGGIRLVGENIEEDMVIAALEAMFWLPETEADVFEPWIRDPRPRVRWTAARLLRFVGSHSIDMEALLESLAEDGSLDKGVLWHIQDGLDHQTYTVKRPAGSGPSSSMFGQE